MTFVNGLTSTEVYFDITDVQIGVYYLVLESYDTASSVKSTLKTDIVTITVTAPAPILTYFTEEIQAVAIIVG